MCGKSRNYGNLACDDSAPTISGDGCDTNCMIEEGFICYGGSENTADSCF